MLVACHAAVGDPSCGPRLNATVVPIEGQHLPSLNLRSFPCSAVNYLPCLGDGGGGCGAGFGPRALGLTEPLPNLNCPLFQLRFMYSFRDLAFDLSSLIFNYQVIELTTPGR